MGYSPWDHKELDMTEVTKHACMHTSGAILTGNFYNKLHLDKQLP